MEDVTKTGPVGLKGLKGVNTNNIDIESLPKFNIGKPSLHGVIGEDNISMSSTGDFGQSMFDPEVATIEQVQDLNETRAEEQPWYAQLGAGIAKGAVLAGTTFLDGTIGLVLGAGSAIKSKNEGASWSEAGSKLWDNDFSRTMKEINEESESAMPNYYTNEEMSDPWYTNIFTSNFIGDKFIKNLGFTIGAMYSGGVASKALKVSKLPQLIGSISKSTAAPAIVSSTVGSFISAVNEGRIEALNNSTDWYNLEKAKLDEATNARMQQIGLNYAGTDQFDIEMAKERAIYEDAMTNLASTTAKMGNSDLLMNLPILTASNAIQFGKLYANGFKTAKKATNIVGKTGETTVAKNTTKNILRASLNPLSEGFEEISQKAASVVSGEYYSDVNNNFYKRRIDPETEESTIDWMKSFAKGINETVNDSSSWEEFFIGYLTGAFGIPTFGKSNNADAWIGKNKAVGMSGGIIGEMQEAKKDFNEATVISDYMNSRVQSPEFLNYYQGLIRHNSYQQDMDNASIENDAFEFRNAEHNQLISDIMMFDKAGRIDDLKALIDSSMPKTDEDIDSILTNTTTQVTNPDGSISSVGPFVDSKGNPMSKEEIKTKINENRDEILNTLNKYKTVKDNLDIYFGDKLNDDQIEELTWLNMQVDNWDNRATTLASEIKPILSDLNSQFINSRDVLQTLTEIEGRTPDVTESYNKLKKSLDSMSDSSKLVDSMGKMNDESLATLLSIDSSLVESIPSALEYFGFSSEYINNFVSKAQDIAKLKEGSKLYSSRLKEYTQNPQKLAEVIDNTRKNVEEETVIRKTEMENEALNSASNLKEFKQVIETGRNTVEALSKAEELTETNPMAQDYIDYIKYANAIKNKLVQQKDKGELNNETYAQARDMLNRNIVSDPSLRNISNPESDVYNSPEIYLSDSDLSDTSKLLSYYDSQYGLLKAVYETNKDSKYKAQFSAVYTKEPIKNVIPNMPSSDTTGASKTTTVPPVNTNGQHEKPKKKTNIIIESPVGVVEKPSSIINDNNSGNSVTNQDVTINSEGLQIYYKSAIPELHTASKNKGDYRPFNVVMQELTGGNYDVIYNYLKDSGAFEYLNSGKLKYNDKIEFMIDSSYESKVQNEEWHTEPTIFMVHNGQVIGVLHEGNFAKNAVGLEELRKRVISEYNNSSKDDKFISKNNSTKVAKMMVGAIPYVKDVIPLNINSASTNGKKPIFGIVKNGIMDTNGTIQDADIVKPNGIVDRNGALYLLVPNGAGSYSSARVMVSHFNLTEFGKNSITPGKTEFYRKIFDVLEQMAESTNPADIGQAVGKLKQYLYLGGIDISYNEGVDGKGSYIRIKQATKDASGNIVVDPITNKPVYGKPKDIALTESNDIEYEIFGSGDIRTDVDKTSKSYEEIAKELMLALMEFNLPVQVNSADINKGNYNESLLNYGVLSSNINQAASLDTWFVTNPVSPDGKEINAIPPKKTEQAPKPTPNTEGSGVSNTLLNTVPVISNGIEYHVDLNNSIIYNKNGGIIKNIPNRIEVLTSAYLNNKYGDSQNGIDLHNNIAYLEKSNKYFNRSTNEFVEKPRDFPSSKSVETPIENVFVTTKVYKDGKIEEVQTTELGVIDGMEIRLIQEPIYTQGLSGKGEPRHVFNQYAIVTPNGNYFKFNNNYPVAMELDSIRENISKALNGNIQRLRDLNSVKTGIEPSLAEDVKTEVITEQPKNDLISEAIRAQQEMKSVQNIDEEFEVEFELDRKVRGEYTQWNQEKELSWLNKVLPQLSENELIQVQSGLLEAATKGSYAWGKFKDGMVIISDIAAEGTVYHEAFHVVFNSLLNNKQKEDLFTEARAKYGNLDNLSLEEELAEGFREYVMSQSKEGLGHKILNFFKNLFAKVTNWYKLSPTIDTLYRNINEGKYSTQRLKDYSGSRDMQEQYSQEMKDILSDANRDEQGRLLADNGNPSNLNERQYAQVRTKAFKEWFGDWQDNSDKASKVIDENGEPLVVYHASRWAQNEDNFNSFDHKKDVLNRGFYFSNALTVDNSYSINDNKRGFFLNIRNPYITDNFNELQDEKSWFEKNGYDGLEFIQDDMTRDSESWEIKVFDNKSIKSATENVGTFDSSNSDIRYREVNDDNGIKRLWHSSDSIIKKFNNRNEDGFFAKKGGSANAIFFADRAPESQSFLSNRKYKMQYDVNLGKSIVIEGVTNGKNYNQDEKHKLMQEAISKAEKEGYDSVVFKDLYDNMMYGDIYVILNPLNIEYVKDQSNTFEGYGENQFKNLPKEQWKSLVKQGWTEEMFNSVSQSERDQAVKCIGI